MNFVDTNIFLRFLRRDEEKQFQQVVTVFQKAESGKVELWTTDIVIFEVFWTLTATYREAKHKAIEVIHQLLSLKGLKVENKKRIIEALSIYKDTGVDFIDAYNAAAAKDQNILDALTFDTDYKRFPWLKTPLLKSSKTSKPKN